MKWMDKWEPLNIISTINKTLHKKSFYIQKLVPLWWKNICKSSDSHYSPKHYLLALQKQHTCNKQMAMNFLEFNQVLTAITDIIPNMDWNKWTHTLAPIWTTDRKSCCFLYHNKQRLLVCIFASQWWQYTCTLLPHDLVKSLILILTGH